MASLVRRAVDDLLEDTREVDAWARARATFGKYSSGRGDIARNHDKYLAEDSGH